MDDVGLRLTLKSPRLRMNRALIGMCAQPTHPAWVLPDRYGVVMASFMASHSRLQHPYQAADAPFDLVTADIQASPSAPGSGRNVHFVRHRTDDTMPVFYPC